MRLNFCTLPLFAFVLVACGEEAETSAFDVGTSLELDVELIDRGVPDMSFDQMLESDSARPDATLTDMAVLPSSADCTSWADVTNAQLVSTLHQHLVNTYVPITPTPNFGGNPDRYTTARQLMLPESNASNEMTRSMLFSAFTPTILSSRHQTEIPMMMRLTVSTFGHERA